MGLTLSTPGLVLHIFPPHKVCRGEAGCGAKPAMWVDGGIHAREWISPAVNTFLLRELVENDAAHPELTQELDWCE